MVYLFLKVEKGSHDELYKAEPETLINAIKNLKYGSSSLHQMLDRK